MGIRKSKHARMDIDNLINKINTNHQIEEDTMAIDKQLEKLREAQNILKEANKALKQATVTLNKAIVALNTANASADNIVSGICKAIVDAQENTTFRVEIKQEDLERIMKLLQTSLKAEEILMEHHRTVQLQNMETHERRIASILNQNNGIWVSDFWMKITVIAILVYSVGAFLYEEIKT